MAHFSEVSLSPITPPLARRLDGLTSSAIRDLLKVAARDDVISLAGGLPDEQCRLLAVALVGMGQVSARFWLQDRLQASDTIEQDTAAGLVAGLAWRGIRGYPRADESRPDEHR